MLSDGEVSKIKFLYATGIRQVELSKRFMVGQPHISKIINGICRD